MNSLKELVSITRDLNHLMKFAQVKTYLKNLGIDVTKETFQNVYITSGTGPFDQLTGKNTFITVSELKMIFAADLVRGMECTVTTYMESARFIWKLNKESINSIEL